MKSFVKKAILPLAVFALAIVGAFAVNTSDAQAAALAETASQTAVEAPEGHIEGPGHCVNVSGTKVPLPTGYNVSHCASIPTIVNCFVMIMGQNPPIPNGMYQVYGEQNISGEWVCDLVLYDQRFPEINTP